MNDGTMSRRCFLAATGTALAVPGALAKGADTGRAARVAFIGVGGRGTGLLKVFLSLPNTEVPAICDINEEHLDRAIEIVKKLRGATPEGYTKGPYDYRRMLEHDDFDAVLIATPAEWHAEMAVDAMSAGKHVGSEVPGAYTVDECWSLVKTKEKTGKRYMLLENYVYARHRMMVQNMARAGVFGHPYYAECSYIHDCSSLRFTADGKMTWRGELKAKRFGNLYPTHSLGPVSKWLGIHNGDRLTSLVSMMSKPAALHAYAVRRFGPDSGPAGIDFVCGDMNVSLIQTAKGRLITVYYDSDSPRPASIFYLLQGTEGVYDSRKGIYVESESASEQWAAADMYLEKYEHPYWREHGDAARKTGHGGGDYFVLSDFADMLRNDCEPLVDVYDSAAWSSVIELSKTSIEKGGSAVEIPDFTQGKWEKA